MNAKDNNPLTPLRWTTRRKHHDVVQLLCGGEKKKNQDKYTVTPLFVRFFPFLYVVHLVFI